jgi:hypothetical protein
MKTEHKNLLGAGIIFALFGGGVLVGAWFLTADTRSFVANSYIVDAEIISVKSKISEDSDNNRTTLYSPKVKFICHKGITIERQDSSWSNKRYRKGDIISLRVANNNAYRFAVNTFLNIWGFSLLLLGIGSGISLMGLTFTVRAIRNIIRE